MGIFKLRMRSITLCLCAGMAVAGALAGCAAKAQPSRQELDGAPGAFTFSSGGTTHIDIFEQGAEYLSKGNFAAAEPIYRQLIVLEPDNASGYVGLGSSLFFQDRYPEAQEAYAQAADLAPEMAEAHIGLGSVAMKTGDMETAMNEYSRALYLDDSSADAHWGLALALETEGHAAGAVTHLKRVLELAPDSILAEMAQAKIDELEAGSNP
jgi:tetratricopeptide (TPR) repeat protein